jgi:hypothetical protein
MKIKYKENPKPRVNFDGLNSGDLFEYFDEFYMKTPVHKFSDSDGHLLNRNAVLLSNGDLVHFCALDMVTPVKFVGYAETVKSIEEE